MFFNSVIFYPFRWKIHLDLPQRLSYSLLREDVMPRVFGFCIIHLQHHLVSTGYATKTKKKLQANPFNAQEVKETVVQAE